MSRYWSDLVHQLEPYVPGEQPKTEGVIKLNTNENPYPPSPQVQQLLKSDVTDSLRRYPDLNSSQLKNALGKLWKVKPEQIFVGNGSDEVLAFSFMAFFKQPRPVLFPDITYSFYTVYCRLLEIQGRQIPLREGFRLNLHDYPEDNGGIVFPNPNAPTGLALSLDDIEALLKRNRNSVVLVDEAYIDFGGESAVALIDRYPNLLVVQTFSKSRSLAGLRVGYAMGNADLIEALDRVKNSFNSYTVDGLAERLATASLDDPEYFISCRDRVIASRDWTVQELQALGFETLPSETNFVLALPPAHVEAEAIANRLRDENILVRHFKDPRIHDYLRITIGSEQDMEQLITTLKRLI